MSDLILPDNRFEAPELFYPNRKPVGDVRLTGEKWDNLYIADLINHKDIDKPIREKYGVRGWDYTGAHSTVDNRAFKDAAVTQLTSIIEFNADAIGSNDVILQTGSYNSHTGNFVIWLDTSGFYTSNANILSVQLNTVRAETEAGSVPVNTRICAVLRWVGGASGGLIVYINGKEVSVTLNASNPVSIPSSAYLRIGGYGGSLKDFNGVLYMAGLRRGALPKPLCKALSANPYKMLIPA